MFCSNCGTELSDDAKFCYKCGKAIQVNESSSRAEKSYEAFQQSTGQRQLACPVCVRSDMIQKVESLVQSNTVTTSYSRHTSGSGKIQGSTSDFTYGSTLSGSGTTQSTLAGRLSFPVRKSPMQEFESRKLLWGTVYLFF